MNRHRVALIALALLAPATVACSTNNPTIDVTNPGPTVTLPAPGVEGGPEVTGTVHVFMSTELGAVGTRLSNGFTLQNPGVEVAFTAEQPRVSMLRIIAESDADIFVADLKSIALLRAFVKGLPSTRRFGREPLVMVVPKGNPEGLTGFADLGDPPPAEAVCTPPYMLMGSAVSVEDAQVPVNEASDPGCAEPTVDAVTAGALEGALVPGSAAGYLRGQDVDRRLLPGAGNLVVPYGLIVLSGREVAKGYANFVASSRGVDVIEESGYVR